MHSVRLLVGLALVHATQCGVDQHCSQHACHVRQQVMSSSTSNPFGPRPGAMGALASCTVALDHIGQRAVATASAAVTGHG